jgi:hypothetical protein
MVLMHTQSRVLETTEFCGNDRSGIAITDARGALTARHGSANTLSAFGRTGQCQQTARLIFSHNGLGDSAPELLPPQRAQPALPAGRATKKSTTVAPLVLLSKTRA